MSFEAGSGHLGVAAGTTGAEAFALHVAGGFDAGTEGLFCGDEEGTGFREGEVGNGAGEPELADLLSHGLKGRKA